MNGFHTPDCWASQTTNEVLALKGRLETQAFLFPLPFLGTMLQTGRFLYHALPRCAAWSQALGHQDQVTLDYDIK